MTTKNVHVKNISYRYSIWSWVCHSGFRKV